MEPYENWLDPDDDFNPENDTHPERNYADAVALAGILGISDRHVRRLAAEGVLKQLPDGRYNRLESIDAFVAHKHRPLPTDSLRARQAEFIGHRLEREITELISRDELSETLSHLSGGFLDAIIEVGELAGRGQDESERSRRREIARQAAGQLEARTAPEIEELLTGKRVQL